MKTALFYKLKLNLCSFLPFLIFKRFLGLMKPDEEILRTIEQENGLATQAEFTLVSFDKSNIF